MSTSAAESLRIDRRRRECVVSEHLGRVYALARRYRASGADAGDLVQEGLLALMEADARFDVARGVPFWAYAAPWVHGAISRFAADQRHALRLPAAARAELSHLRSAGEPEGDRRANPPLAVAARRAGISPERAGQLLAAARSPRSLQEAAGGEAGGGALVDLVADPRAEEPFEEVVERAGRETLGEVLTVLSEREREVIERRFGFCSPPERLADVGRRMGVTRERVRQIEARALDRMRDAAQAPRASARSTRPAGAGRERVPA